MPITEAHSCGIVYISSLYYTRTCAINSLSTICCTAVPLCFNAQLHTLTDKKAAEYRIEIEYRAHRPFLEIPKKISVSSVSVDFFEHRIESSCRFDLRCWIPQKLCVLPSQSFGNPEIKHCVLTRIDQHMNRRVSTKSSPCTWLSL